MVGRGYVSLSMGSVNSVIVSLVEDPWKSWMVGEEASSDFTLLSSSGKMSGATGAFSMPGLVRPCARVGNTARDVAMMDFMITEHCVLV